jgi:hypothetical protein
MYEVCFEIPLHLIKFRVKGKFVLTLYSSQSLVDISRIAIAVPCIRIPGARFDIQIDDSSATLSPEKTA